MLSRSIILSLLAAPAALAASCYGNGNPGLSADAYQQAADQVCNYGPSFDGYIDGHQIQAEYQGNEKLHCQVRAITSTAIVDSQTKHRTIRGLHLL